MDKEEIIMWDWHRILIGNAPVIFLVEVFIRTAVIYICLLIAVRLMGKRMGGQASILEMAVMITLGAFVAVPMQLQDRGLLFGIVAFVIAILFQRGVNQLGIYYPHFEKFIKGENAVLIKDGEIQTEEIKKARISNNQLHSILRNEGILSHNQVKRLYLEASGLISIYEYPDSKFDKASSTLPEKDDF